MVIGYSTATRTDIISVSNKPNPAFQSHPFTMGDTGQPPPGGGGTRAKYSQIAMSNPVTPASGGDSVDSSSSCRMRNFAEILNDEQQHRNIL